MIALGIPWWAALIYVILVVLMTLLVLGLCMSASNADEALERARMREGRR